MTRFFEYPWARSSLCGLGLLVVSTVAGCDAGRGNVSGEVKYNGQPLPSGQITFLSQAGDKKVVTAQIEDGKYTVNDLPAGPAVITVRTTPPPRPAADPGGRAIKPPEGSQEVAPTAAGKYVPIPARYGNPDQSGLNYTVTGGNQTHTVELTR